VKNDCYFAVKIRRLSGRRRFYTLTIMRPLPIIGALCVWLALASPAAAAAPDVDDLYRQGLKSFYAERYDEAESAFATVYRLAPGARFAADAAFKAGEAAYRQEHYDAAIRHFSHYLRHYPLGASRQEAEMRLAAAQAKAGTAGEPLPLPAVKKEWPRLKAAWVDEIPSPTLPGMDRYFSALRRAGYNTVVVPAYKTPTDKYLIPHEGKPCTAGAYFTTDQFPVCANLLGDIVVAAHKADLRLIAVMPVRAPRSNPPQSAPDRRWDAQRGEIVPDPGRADLFDESHAARLSAAAGDLARLGPDGIWFGPDLVAAPDEGLSEPALSELQRTINRPFLPGQIFADLPTDADGRIRRGRADYPYTAYCEMRAARLRQVIEQMETAVRQAHPSCRLGVVAPWPAIDDPLVGLRDYALDLDGLLAKKERDAVMLFDLRSWQNAQGSAGTEAYAALPKLSERLLKAAGGPRRAVAVIATVDQRFLPDWVLKDLFRHLVGTGECGVALAPPTLQQPLDAYLTIPEESSVPDGRPTK